jgi:tetratricopeptide (TPR) repeat protein
MSAASAPAPVPIPLPHHEGSSERRFKNRLTLLIAGLTFITSLIVFINVRASSRSAAAVRDGRIVAIRYLGFLGRSLWSAAEEKDLMNTYQETTGLMLQAQVYERMAKNGGDAAFFKMVSSSLDKSRALLLARGELAKPPYFNAPYGAFDYFQYFLDRVYIPTTALKEREEQKWTESSFWSAKSDSYTAGLAVMAVALFLLTLSLVIHAHIRVIIACVGGAMVAAVLALTGFTALSQWRGRTEDSIRLLAQASGNALYAQMIVNYNGDTDAAAVFAGRAKSDVNKVMREEGDYPAAVLLRARIHSVLGEARYLAGKADNGRAELEQAAADLDRAIRAGKTEGFTYWSKGYVNFLLGRRAESLAALDKALALLPKEKFTIGLVKAVALLYAGKVKEARALTEEAVEFALKTPLGGDAMNVRTIIKNIERFNELGALAETAARPGPGGPAGVPAGLPEMIARLKEAAVCLAVLNKARPGEVKAEITPPHFVDPVFDAQGTIVETPAAAAYKNGTARAYFQIELKGMEKGQSLVRKIYRRAPGQVFWMEQLWLGRAEHWDGPAEARIQATVESRIPEAGETLTSGDYRLEIFVEGKLVAAGNFKVL